MIEPVYVKRYPALLWNTKEILRYASSSANDASALSLLEECRAMAQDSINLSLCYARYPAKIENGTCDLGFAMVDSKNLADNLAGCQEIVVFAATAGVGIYQLQQKYSALSPSRALMLGAIGTERVETLCDAFCAEFAENASREGLSLRPRFSPGYGDFPLSFQRQIFDALCPEKHIGVYLNEHNFMIPPKSVTAVFGLFYSPHGEDQ